MLNAFSLSSQRKGEEGYVHINQLIMAIASMTFNVST